eukprot:7418369-Pyramimonas_sp.AAC.1
MELFDFDLGRRCAKSPFIPLLLEICQGYVNSKRGVSRLGAFGLAQGIADSAPWAKIAVAMRACRNAPPEKRGMDAAA